MRKALTVAITGAALVLATAPAAFAGEVTGNGKATPIREKAGSICAFSGQNDDPDDPRPFEDGRVQSFGDIVQEAVGFMSVEDRLAMIHEHGPGVSCRGYASGFDGGGH
jgi:hypothetical protein